VKPVIFSEAATQDFEESVAWYRNAQPDCSAEFAAEIYRCADIIEQRPAAYAIYCAQYRRILLRRFPYFLLYWETLYNIEIVAVGHAKRGPRFWQSRM